MTRRLIRVGMFLALPVLLFAIWWFASAGSTDFYQPPLSSILSVFPDTWFGDRMAKDVLPSLARLLAGLALALVAGIGFGWLAVWTTNLGAPIAAHFTINFLNLRFIVAEPAVLLRGSRPAV